VPTEKNEKISEKNVSVSCQNFSIGPEALSIGQIPSTGDLDFYSGLQAD